MQMNIPYSLKFYQMLLTLLGLLLVPFLALQANEIATPEYLIETPEPIPSHYRLLVPEAPKGGVEWSTLEEVVIHYTLTGENTNYRLEFSEQVQALHRRRVVMQGFMLPLEQGERIGYFLLSALPAHCPFCLPAGPARLIEVYADKPLRYTDQAIMIEGRFHVLDAQASGMFYRITDARSWP